MKRKQTWRLWAISVSWSRTSLRPCLASVCQMSAIGRVLKKCIRISRNSSSRTRSMSCKSLMSKIFCLGQVDKICVCKYDYWSRGCFVCIRHEYSHLLDRFYPYTLWQLLERMSTRKQWMLNFDSLIAKSLIPVSDDAKSPKAFLTFTKDDRILISGCRSEWLVICWWIRKANIHT